MKKKTVCAVLITVLIAGCIAIPAILHIREEARLAELYGVPQLSMTFTEDNFSELERYTALQTVDFQDSTCYPLMLQYARDHKDISVTYRVDVGGTKLTNHDSDITLSPGSFDLDALLAGIPYLPELRSISLPRTDLTAEQIQSLHSACADVTLTWTVLYRETEYPWDTTRLTLENADYGQAVSVLSTLPLAQDVTFTGTAPAQEDMLRLKESFENIRFHWDFTLFDIPVSADTAELDLSGIPMASTRELEDNLVFFNCLEKVILCDTGLPSSEIDALWKRHPETRFVWNIQIGRFSVRTDITFLIPYQYGYYGTDIYGRLTDVDCTEMKYLVDMVCLDMGHMYITDISFVRNMPNLEFFIIGDSRVTDLSPLVDVPKLKYLEAFFSGVTDISPLARCYALEDVNLCHNQITDFSPLFELKHLRHIWIAGHYISEEDKARLEAAHPDAVIVYNLVGSTGAGWRHIPNYYAQRDYMGMPYMEGTP